MRGYLWHVLQITICHLKSKVRPDQSVRETLGATAFPDCLHKLGVIRAVTVVVVDIIRTFFIIICTVSTHLQNENAK